MKKNRCLQTESEILVGWITCCLSLSFDYMGSRE